MLIHQITDIHIPDVTDDRFPGTKPNVLKQFEFIAAKTPDMLVISGDLSMTDKSVEACEWIRENLPDVAGMTTVVMPGNHDDPQVLWDVFGPELCHDRSFFHVLDGIVFLDSGPYTVSEKQLHFLASVNEEVLFIHHPPCLIGSGFMSQQHALRNHEAVASAVRDSSVNHVFCGHFHNSAEVVLEGFDVHLTPSPAFEIDLDESEFCIVDFQPAVRQIDYDRDTGVISTNLAYL